MNAGILELDLHGCTVYQAEVAVDAALRRAKGGTYRLRLIHGYHRGTELQQFLRKKYKNHPKVLRLELGMNPGVTEFVLREF